ncbi:MAG: signal recognition particle protein Srp19 [Candidatus Nezhaarchaeota archaeon]|nr:signal recognition particle protein Srp19 [Candidatus Nezhaarchaeota archaeon]
MKESGWQRLYLVYFDRSKTRKQGRRVSRELAVDRPRLEEVLEAIKKLGLGLGVKVVEGVRYPRCWWDYKGLILVEKKLRKSELLSKVASILKSIRAAAQ